MVKAEGPRREPALEELQGQQFASVYLGWHDSGDILDQQIGVEPVETQLVDKNFVTLPITSRQDALARLSGLRASIVPSTPVGEYMRDTISATLTYADAVSGGQRLPIRDYVKRTLGIEIDPPKEDELMTQRELVEKLAEEAGVEFTAEGYKKYFEEDKLTEEEIRSNFFKSRDVHVPIIARAVGAQHHLPLRYELNFVDLPDAGWSFHSINRREGPKFDINISEKTRWPKGAIEELGPHEHWHLLQSQIWREKLSTGELNPAYGIEPAPSPLSWTNEAIASTIYMFVPELYDVITPLGRFDTQAKQLQRLANYGLMVMANEGASIEDIKIHYRKYIPFETDERIERLVRLRSENPFQRTYHFTYSDGVTYLSRVAKDLSEANGIKLLRAVLKYPMTPTQLKAKIAEIKAA